MTEHMNFRPVGADYDLTRLANNICGTGGLRPATIFATRRESTLRGENQSRCLLIILAELEAQISAHARGRIQRQTKPWFTEMALRFGLNGV